jgi:predicted nucleic acid-binding protein
VAGEDLLPGNECLLDTGVVIRHLRNDKRAHDLLDFIEANSRINISVITYLEILLGCRPSEEEATRDFFDRVSTIAISQEVAQKAAFLIKKYPDVFGKQIGRGTPDGLIAATSWQMHATLITLNTRQFAKVPIVEIRVFAIKQNTRDWTQQFKY